MLPWEHAAVGYCCYSLLHRLVRGRPPDGRAAIAILLAAVLPDLIDKPLAWEFGLLPGGRSLGHSLAFAVATTALVAWIAERRTAAAFAVSALAHLLTDVYYPVVFGGEPVWSFLAWPLLAAPPSDVPGLLGRTSEIATDLEAFLATTRGRLYLLFELLLVTGALVLWLLDGAPGVEWARPDDPRSGEPRGDH